MTRDQTSSGTALMLVNPLRNTTKTLLAPHLRAEVAQSNAVSPAPSTSTLHPCKSGRLDLHVHMPTMNKNILIDMSTLSVATGNRFSVTYISINSHMFCSVMLLARICSNYT